MEFEGSRTISTDKDHLWTLISDPGILMNCVPGAQEIERVSETRYTGQIQRGFNRINVTFDGELEFVEFEAPDRLVATANAHDSRTNSSLDLDSVMEMHAGDNETELEYEVSMNFSGRLASLGSYIVRSKIESDIDTFFDNIRDQVEADAQST